MGLGFFNFSRETFVSRSGTFWRLFSKIIGQTVKKIKFKCTHSLTYQIVNWPIAAGLAITSDAHLPTPKYKCDPTDTVHHLIGSMLPVVWGLGFNRRSHFEKLPHDSTFDESFPQN